MNEVGTHLEGSNGKRDVLLEDGVHAAARIEENTTGKRKEMRGTMPWDEAGDAVPRNYA